MENQKADNMLNLAWDATPSERERSLNLNTGYNQIERTWDVIIKYNGDISVLLRNFVSKNIKIVPKLYVDGSVLSYVIINFDNFTPNGRNPEFRDNIIEFDIICHFD